MRASRLGCLSATIILLSIPSDAAARSKTDLASLPEWTQCKGGQGIADDAQFAACTAVIRTRIGSRDPRPYAIRCSLLVDQFKLDDAIKDCSRAIKLDPRNVDAYHARAVAYLSKKQNDRAVADCNMLLRLKPDMAGTLVLRGMAYSQKGDYDRAIADFTLSSRLRPGFAMAESGLAEAQQAKARLSGGQTVGDPRAWCDGKSLPQEGFREDLQIKGCTTLIEAGKESGALLAEDYFKRGGAYDIEQQHAKAMADYGEAIRLKPDYAEAWHWRGALRWVANDYDGAIADLTNAIKFDRSRLLSFSYRGNAYLAKGQFDSAIGDFDEVLKLEPGNADAFVRLCRARIGKGDYTQAIADCDQAIKLSRTSEATEGYNGRGDAHVLMGDFTAAVGDYDHALALWPEYPEALYGRGIAKGRAGDASGGKADLDAARQLKADIDAAEAKAGIRQPRAL